MLADDDPPRRVGRDVFTQVSTNRHQFYYAVGETPEMFFQLYNLVAEPIAMATGTRDPTALNRRNQLLPTLLWPRTYPVYNTLSKYI